MGGVDGVMGPSKGISDPFFDFGILFLQERLKRGPRTTNENGMRSVSYVYLILGSGRSTCILDLISVHLNCSTPRSLKLDARVLIGSSQQEIPNHHHVEPKSDAIIHMASVLVPTICFTPTILGKQMRQHCGAWACFSGVYGVPSGPEGFDSIELLSYEDWTQFVEEP